MKRIAYVTACALALSACASLEPARPCQTPKAPPVPAWILEPGPNLRNLLDKLISPYETESTKSTLSSPPVKTN